MAWPTCSGGQPGCGRTGAVELPHIRVSCWQADETGQLLPASDNSAVTVPGLRVLIIPPSLESAPQAELLERHRAPLCLLHGRGTVLASVCIGVFFIAASGLLDGRPACTRWNYVHALAQRFPRVRVEAQQPLLDDGDIVTSAGLMAWTDLGLRLLERFGDDGGSGDRPLSGRRSGRGAAARRCVQPAPGCGDEAVLKVQHWLQGNGGQDADLATMAACAGLEARTFLRRFRAATGLRPTEYCQQVRVGRACRLLEFTRRNVEQIAWGVGYQDPGAFRKVFQRVTGLPRVNIGGGLRYPARLLETT
jgi:transcriptional regulator GlxA family with amidase domain